jgi:hypothetical protein
MKQKNIRFLGISRPTVLADIFLAKLQSAYVLMKGGRAYVSLSSLILYTPPQTMFAGGINIYGLGWGSRSHFFIQIPQRNGAEPRR